jgi:hypothetical protein
MPAGHVLIPTGVHVIDLHAVHGRQHHFPEGRPR